MKKIISVCLALVLLLACVPLQVSAEGAPSFSVGTVFANPGDTVQVPVNIENNPGIVACKIMVSYDQSLLTLTAAEFTSLFSAGSFTTSGSLSYFPFALMWDDGTGESNHTESGAFAMLTFAVSDDAPRGVIEISLSYTASNVFDVDMQNVSFQTQSGGIEIGGWSIEEDSTLYTYEGESGVNYIAGVDILDDDFISPHIVTTGGWSFEVEENSQHKESTGAKLVIYDYQDNVVEEYFVVFFGDVNGDGDITGIDVQACIKVRSRDDFDVPDEYAQAFAADVDHNDEVTGIDCQCIFKMIAKGPEIYQFIND
ncbi:MAG: hypothetical protein IJT44_04810 [Clostridia bacterium]|nr:hypothetical protein [Clostridia bacterium]